jgi:AraC-like DNA-binding protein
LGVKNTKRFAMRSNVLIVTQQRDEIMQKLNECLHGEAHSRELSVDWLARLLHMSRPTLYRKMKSLTGLTPNELINEARLNRAATLLAGGEHRAFEVAKMVGYTSQSSFGKSFLKQFKMTPANYQRSIITHQ